MFHRTRIAPVLLTVCILGAATEIAASDVLGASGATTSAKVCHFDIVGNDLMQYDKKELKVGVDCTQIELSLQHSGKLPASAMGHNWVLTKDADAEAVASDGITAGLKSDYVKSGDIRVIAYTAIIGGGQSVTIKFPTSLLKKGEGYTYECTFPGHNALLHGKLIFG